MRHQVIRQLLISAVCHSCILTAAVSQEGTAQETSAFQEMLQRKGLTDITREMSDAKTIQMDMPACSYMNITGTTKMPQKKTEEQHVWMDVYTDNGTHFRKRAVISAQGNSSLQFPKKNFKADFVEDEWVGDKPTDITIGDWVKQDGFHFKAYYTDYLRGVAVVGLRLYDQMALNTGRAWTRAVEHIGKPKENARCYPDGFPCIVYLNGEFYGIFAWQLKKHRDNMNQKKTTEEHIHLDGKLSTINFWGAESISWKDFEVRNPKGLYTMDGNPYDGDNPKELMDETSAHFGSDTDDTASQEDKERTARVKHRIVALSHAYSKVEDMRASNADTAEIHTFIESRFDLPGMLDYACLHFAVNNYDGFSKNWQWFTYDGEKWFVAPYDLDCIIGNRHTGTFLVPPDRNYASGGNPWQLLKTYGPMSWLTSYYADELKDRWITLREAGIIDEGNISRLLDGWYDSVSDFYDEEWKRWPESKCISETITNPGWKQIDTGYNQPAWNDTTTYHPGDRCTMGSLAWEATEEVCAVRPYSWLGYRDSLDRYKAWVRQRIEVLDEHFDYYPIATAIAPSAQKDAQVVAIYDVSGRKRARPTAGINIYQYSDGRTRKVVVR